MPTETEPTQATPASQWKKPAVALPEGLLITLPSGNTCRVIRQGNLLTMIKENRIPNPLADLIASFIAAKESNQAPDMTNVDSETVIAMMAFVDKIVVECLIEPRCYAHPMDAEGERVDGWVVPEGGIALDDIDQEDKLFLFGVALGGATDLASFREQQKQVVATTSDGADIQPETITVPRNPRPLPGVVSR